MMKTLSPCQESPESLNARLILLVQAGFAKLTDHMKLGLLIAYSEEDLSLLQRRAFTSCELLIFPDGPLSPTRGSGIDDWKRAKERFQELDIEISAIGSYTNHLSPHVDEQKTSIEHFERLFEVAETMDVKTLATFAGRDPEKDISDNIPRFREVFSHLTQVAEDKGMRIAIENCPMFHGFPFRGINLAYTPESWELMFDAVPSRALGLEYDPSHLICLNIDYLKCIRNFGDRIYHVHAKDAELLPDAMNHYGFLDVRSMRHRMPGFGDVDWRRVIAALREIGYTGNIDIEGRHDAVFCEVREEEGLRLAAKHLNQFL